MQLSRSKIRREANLGDFSSKNNSEKTSCNLLVVYESKFKMKKKTLKQDGKKKSLKAVKSKKKRYQQYIHSQARAHLKKNLKILLTTVAKLKYCYKNNNVANN